MRSLLLLCWMAAPTAAQYCWNENPIAMPTNGAWSLQPADVDGDGDLDLVTSGDDITLNVYWHENLLGDGSAWARRTIGGGLLAIPKDVDGDGDIDVLTRVQNDYVWYEQTAGAWVPRLIGQGTSLFFVVDLQLADFDGDGDDDVLVHAGNVCCGGPDTYYWFEDTGSYGAPWPFHSIGGTFSSTVLAIESADIDGDGDLDLLASHLDAPRTHWRENTDGTGDVWTQHSVAPTAAAEILRAGDMDGDGDLDIVAALFNGVFWYENLDGQGGAWGTRDPGIPGFPGELLLNDMDGDGDPDIVHSHSRTSTSWYSNPGPGGGSWTRHPIGSIGGFTDGRGMAIADLDGDAFQEVVVTAPAVPISSQPGTFAWFDDAVTPSAQFVFLGNPPNPLALQPAAGGGPAIGQVWDPVVTPFQPGGTVVFLAIDLAPPINLPTPAGTLLCNPPPPDQIFVGLAGAPFSIPVPPDCSFVGVSACAQAGSFGPGAGLALANGLELVIGTDR